MIIEKLYDEIQKGHGSENIMDQFDDQEIINYLSGILAYDFEITDVEKAIEDVEKAYIKESKIERRNFIIHEIENDKDMNEAKRQELEQELNNIMIELTKIK